MALGRITRWERFNLAGELPPLLEGAELEVEEACGKLRRAAQTGDADSGGGLKMSPALIGPRLESGSRRRRSMPN